MPSNNPQLAVLTHEHFIKNKVSDGLTETNIALAEMKSKGKIDYNVRGTKVVGLVRNSRHTVTQWGPMAEPAIVQPSQHERWEHEWGGVYGSYYIDDWDKYTNDGEEALAEMQDEYLKGMNEDVNEYFEDYVFANGLSLTPKGFGGFEAFIKDTGTYGGISQTNDYWKAQVVGGSSFSAAPLKVLNRLFNLCTRGKARSKSGRPSSVFFDRANWNAVHDKIESIRRIITNEEKAKVGHTNFVVDGVEGFWSDSCPASTAYAINWNHIMAKFATPKMFISRTKETITPIGTVFQILGKGQFICDNPRMQGKISNTGIT